MNPETPSLYPYQLEGKDFLLRNRVAFLADQPGLGKTAQAITAARDHTDVETKRVAIICPKSSITNWWRELDRWWPQADRSNILVTNYEQLITQTPDAKVWNLIPFNTIICDEAHRLKTSGSQRSKAVYHRVFSLRKEFPKTRVHLLSGTPAKNHAGEMWTHLAMLRPDLIMDRSKRPMAQEQFEELYCRVGNDEYGRRRIFGSRNVGALRNHLYGGGFMLRRLKRDVQKHLPELTFDEYPLNVNGRMVVGANNHPKIDGMTYEGASEWLRDNHASMAEWRHECGKLKVQPTKELADVELDTPSEKIIMFFHHTAVGNELFNLLAEYQPVLVNGAVNNPQALVDVFQENPNCRVFLGQLQACSEALNITAATQVWFVEAGWSPSDNYQAACRAHRIGLKHNLIVRFLSLPNTTDQLVQQVLQRKAQELHDLFD